MTHTHFLYILQINKDPLYRFDTNSCSIQFSLTINQGVVKMKNLISVVLIGLVLVLSNAGGV